MALSPWFDWLSTALLFLAALLFLGQAIKRLALPTGSPALFRRVATRLRGPGGFGPRYGVILGLTLGFLPCGFLYSALAASAATGNPIGGAVGMLAFGLGTIPALVMVGVVGQTAGRVWSRRMALVAPGVMLLNALILAALAWQGLSQLL